MDQGRLITDKKYVNELQKEIYKTIENEPTKLISITNNEYTKAIFINELKNIS